MSYGPTPGEWQGNPAEQQPPFGDQPPYQGQTWPASPGGEPGQQQPPSYGQPGYAAPGYVTPGYGASPYGKPPPTRLAWAWIATVGGVLFSLILGFPFGLIALKNAQKVRQYLNSGPPEAALAASRKATIFASVSTVFDVIGIVLVIVLLTHAASATSGFNNPAVVAASIKTQLQKRISDPSSQFYSPGLKVTSVVCTRIGAHTDRCVDHFSNGQTASEIAVISANGDRYLTH